MSDIGEWNWSTKHVQADTRNGEFVTARSTLLLAGPARLEHVAPSIGVSPDVTVDGGAATVASASLFPIGIVQDLQMGSQRPLTRFHEVGSLRSYFVAQRNAIQWSMGRVLFSGASLLRTFYASAPDEAITAAGGPTERGNLGSVTILRRLPDGSETRIEVNVKKIRRGKERDVRLERSDTVIVGEWFF